MGTIKEWLNLDDEAKIEIKTDCTLYAPKCNRCNALSKLFCKTEKCSFYKSIKDYPREKYKEELKAIDIEVWS